MSEPTTLIDAIAPAPEAWADVVADWKGKVDSAPGDWHAPGMCRHCGVSLGESEEDKVMSIGAFGWLPNVCCPSCAKVGKERIEEEARRALNSGFSGIIPAEFIHWNIGIGRNDVLSKVNGKFSFETRRGLTIFGPSGSCKTRVAWELVKRIVSQPQSYSWAFVDSYDCATAGFPPNSATVDYLIIDDLGNEPATSKFETALLRLIRKRCDWHKPTIITTQLTAIDFKRQFFKGPAAEAIMRRLRERNDTINTDGTAIHQ
jgi:DNA replication protein DnaC